MSWDAQSKERQIRLSEMLFNLAYHGSIADRHEAEPTVEFMEPIKNIHANDTSDLDALELELPYSNLVSVSSSSTSNASSTALHSSSPPSLLGKRVSDDSSPPSLSGKQLSNRDSAGSNKRRKREVVSNQ
jgi:hypothetical protein